MAIHHYLACDLGAESGRVMLGSLEGDQLTIEEIHRFPNGPVAVSGSIRWDLLRMFEKLKTGLAKVAARGVAVESLSTDSWGVDYVFLRGDEPMLTVPYHYRDVRTDDGYERAFAVVPADDIFAETGIQFMTLNTLFQLHADLTDRPWVLECADQFLNIGDYFNFLFSGAAKSEESLASTTQLYNPKEQKWSASLISRFGFPEKIFPEVVKSGTVIGDMLPEIAEETGLQNVKVVAGCSHDTGAAVAAVPAEGEGWAYLSSGTWSLLGIEAPAPIITAKSQEYNFTNEVGYNSSIRFLKNIIGLWIVQESRRTWQKAGQDYDYDQMTQMASEAQPLKALIHPADDRFAKPGDMPQRIAEYCRETGQEAPETPGEVVRCVLESLALLYRQTLEQMEDVTEQQLTTLHIVGGGSKNRLLNQLSANATQRKVVAGPAEATATGSLLIQAMALGHLPSLDALRNVVRQSFDVETFQPEDATTWQEAYDRFRQLPS